ncbi:hypothetical protein N8Z40_03425 [Pseudomonadales bacterium]|nr:hypothetical protein [Pseudomonadales bacterium]
MKKKITLIVFSLTTSLEDLISIISSRPVNEMVLCLSPHVVFDYELKIIRNQVSTLPIFTSFYQYISEAEMIYCDVQADQIIQERFGDRMGRLEWYFDQIKLLKNEIIYKNIKSRYDIDQCYVLAEDLGIMGKAFIDKNTKSLDTGSTDISDIIKSGVKKLFTSTNITVLNGNDRPIYLVGEAKRITQYLDREKYYLTSPNLIAKLVVGGMLKICLIKKLDVGVLDKLADCFLALFGFITKRFLTKFNFPLSTSIHEYNDALGWVAKSLSVPCINIQDGYLPAKYSAYLKYRVGVTHYFIWDSLSSGIFELHGLSCSVWDCFKRNDIPTIVKRPAEVHQVLFLTSGAGDWTALKNRSDEDLSFLAFSDVAKEFKNIKFIYRPHPLWLHPEHQGTRSIERISEFCEAEACGNLVISGGAILEGSNFTKDGNLSAGSASIEEEIAGSDIIFGDHSQALLAAAEKGKIVASVNCCKRSSLFFGHTSIGFPLLESSGDMEGFIANCLSGDFSGIDAFIENYNAR